MEKIPHILIVDDDPNLIGSMSDILKAKGFEPVTVITGESALKSIEQYRFEVALIDLRLDDISGLEVLQAIKSRSPETECILLTGHASQNSAIEAIQLGVFGFFQKPFDMEQLLLSIQNAIEKHAAADALHKSEQRYRVLFEDSPIAIWEEDFSEVKHYLDSLKRRGVTDFRTFFASHPDVVSECSSKIKVLDVNNAAVQMFRAENKEALVKHTNSGQSKGEEEHNHEDFLAIAEGKAGNSWEGSDETLTGEPVEISLSWSVVPGFEDDYSKVIVTTFDITERRRAEGALRQSEGRFHALIQNAADLIIVIDSEGVIQYASPSAERILGYTDHEFLGQNFSGWVHPEDLPLAVESLVSRREIPGTAAESIQVRCLHKNGTWRVIEVLGTNLLAEPSIKGIVMNIRDVTERKQVEDQLRLLSRAVEQSASTIVITDMAGNIEYANSQFTQTTGYSVAEALGQNPRLLKSGHTPPQEYQKMWQMLAAGREWRGEFQNKKKNGELYWESATISSILNERGEITNFLAVKEDITERKLADAALRESEERYQLANHATFNAVWDWDLQTNKVWWNDNFYSILGYSPGDIEPNINSWINGIHPDDLERINTSMSAFLDSEKQTWFEQYRFRRKDGTYADVEDRGLVSRDANGNALRMIGAMQDITERRQAEAALRRSEKSYYDLFEDSPIALVEEDFSAVKQLLDILRQDGVSDFSSYLTLHPEVVVECAKIVEIKNVNKAALRMYRAGNINEMPKNLSEILSGKAIDHFKVQLAAIAEGQIKFGWEGINHTIDGGQIDVEVNWSAAGHEKDLSKVIVSLQDITERKQNEEQLRLQSSALNAAANSIMLTDITGKIKWVNPAFSKLTGYTLEEALEKNPRDLLKSDKQDQAFYKEMWDTILSDNVWQGEIINRNKDGTYSTEELTITPLKDAAGGINHFIAIQQDITERKQAEKTLREREEQYRTLVEQLPAIVFIDDVNDEGRTIYVSPQIETILGFTPQQWQKESPGLWVKQVHPDDLERVHAGYMRCFQYGEPYSAEYRISASDGRLLWFRDQAVMLRDEDGKPHLIHGLMYDITERKQAEEILSDRERSLRESQMIAGLGSYVFDISLGMWTSSEVLDQIFGIDESYVRSVDGWQALIHPDFRQEMSDYLAQKILKNHARFDREYKIVRKSDGVETWVHGLGELELDAQNQPVKLQGTIQDITRRKQAEEITRQQGEQLRLLYEASQRLNRTLDPHEIYQAVCDFMSTVAPNDGLFISGFDPESQLITCRAYWMEGKWLDVSPFPSIPLEEEGKGTQSRVIRSGQSMLIDDYQKFLKTSSKVYYVDSETNQFVNEVSPDKDVTRSALIVPLKSGDAVIGVIQVVSNRLNAYTESQLKLLESLALHIVSAEKNALLYTQMQVELNERRQVEKSLRDREEQYRTLVEQVPAVVYIDDATTEPGQTIYISPQIENILGFTVDEWRQGDLESWLARIHPDDSQQTLAEYLRCFKDGERIDSEYRMIAADGRCLWIRDQAVRLGDETGKPRFIHGIMYDITQRKWSDEAISQRVMELELLYESGLAFIQLLHPKDIAQKIINLLEQKMDWHHTAIRLFDPQTKTMRLLAFNQPDLTSAEEMAAMEEQLQGSVKRSGQGLSGWVIQHGQTVRTDDLANDERYFETLPGMKSGLYVPIKLGDRVIGAISIESKNLDAFSAADERLTETLANQAASALENARLFDETNQRITELTALHRTGQTLLAARLNPEEIYAAVHKAVAETMPCEAFVIVLDDEEHGEYHAVYFFDKGERFPMRRLPRGKGLSGRIISSGETLFIHDTVETTVEATHFGSMESTRSILAVPLRRGDKTIGMLSTQSYQPRVFGEPQRVMLETIAAQLSSALDNATLYQQTQARINELETLHTISTSLRTIQTVDKALSTLLDNTLLALETTAGEIMLHDPSRNELRDVVSRGWFARMDDMPIKVGEGVAGKVFASGESYHSVEFIRDALPHASTRNEIPAGWGGVCMPIRTSTEIIGVLFVSVQLPSQISSQQIKLLESLVEMAGAAVHRMRLYDETARRAEEFASLYEMSRALSAEYDLDSLLDVIVNSAKDMLSATTSGMYLYHAESRELELMTHIKPSVPVGTRLQLGEGAAGKVAQTRQPLRIDDYSTWEGRSPKYDNLPIHAVIEVPMLYAGELIGVLTADEAGDSSRKFTEADERLLSLFASHAAGAINSARQRADTIRYAGELEQRVLERTAEIEFTRQRLDLAVSAGGIGVWEINLKDNRIFWDGRMHAIHGTDPEKFDNSLGAWWQMFYYEDLERTQAQFMNALQNTGTLSDEHRIIHSDGSLRNISASAVVLYDGDHIPERMIGVNVDVTEQKRAENEIRLASLEMERAMRTKDEFLANMSHELRTPLNSILGISESLEEQIVGNLNEKQLRYIGIVKESGRHLLELINDILDISKIEAGRMELELHNVSVEKLCQSSLRMVKELAQKKNLKVSFEVMGSVEVVLGDERRLKQSLVNLLSNAVKFTPSESHIGLEVCGHPKKNEVTFTVWDKGVGIAKEEMQYLFKPFVQLDSGLTREYQGTGLGLALVSQMIRLHGGRIDLESEVGEGSRFTITLPWLPEQQNLRTKSTGELPRSMLRPDEKRSGKVLLVEDTEVISSLMNEYLQYKGYQVFIARNGMEGFLLAKQEIPDLILMDVMMPVMDGLESTRLIREIDLLKDTPIIALTALAMPGDRERCFAAGMTDYLSKPLRIQELADMIQKHLMNKD